MKIKRIKALSGKISLPGDKSISHRAAIIASLAEGETRIENFASSADCAATLSCLQSLGVEIKNENANVFIKGVGKTGLTQPAKPLDCENSGTTLRLLAGVLAGQNFDSILTGDASLSKRPMQRIIEPLKMMGARIESKAGCAPLKIRGKNPLRAISYDLPIASAQVKSCVLLAGLNAEGKTKIQSPKSKIRKPNSRNHTELMLTFFGAETEENFIEAGKDFVHQVLIGGDSKLVGRNFSVPADVSSAAFFIVAAACLKSSNVVLENVGLNPTRTAIIEVLRDFGARIEVFNEKEVCNEIVGDLRVTGGETAAPKSVSNKIDGDFIPNLIDEIPILAVFGTQTGGGLEIRDAGELRVKESDRITAIVENLRRMNAEVEEFADGFRVKKSELKAATIDSFGDHRIAMAFSIAALFAEGETEIVNAECASVSFPEFFQVLTQVVK